MNIVPILLLGLAALLSLCVGLLVFARDHNKLENLAFFGISIGIFFWAVGIAGFIVAHSFTVALEWSKFYYFAPLILVFASVIFAQDFLVSRRFRPLINGAFTLGGLSLAIPLLLDPSFITAKVVSLSYGKRVILNSHEYLLYSLYLLLCFIVTLYVVWRKSRQVKDDALIIRQQANFFLVGYGISCFLGVFFNLFLPAIGNYSLIVFGPTLSTIFLFSIAYAIARHRLFDVRLVVARTIAYTSSLIVMAAIYGFVVFGVAVFIFKLHFSLLTQLFLSGATGVAAIGFGRLRRLFDVATNRIFYRDAYEPQMLFDHLNKILVSTVDLNKLLRQSSVLLSDTFKSHYAAIGLREIAGKDTRIFGTSSQVFTAKDIQTVRRITPSFHRSVIATDYLDPDQQILKELLNRNNVSVLVRLSQDVRKSEEGLGYILLGPKRSGNPYTNQDLRILDTVAKELIIAIQNALRYEEIENFNQTLQGKVEEATRKLRRVNEKLKELDETKDDFISMASHQLRTPLTSVKGYISMVLEGDAGKLNEQQQKLLEQSFFSSQRMVYLISDLLNVSRLKTGKFIIEPSPVNLADMVEQEMEQLKLTAASKGLTFTYDKPSNFPTLMLDETKTRQIIMNFADNAIYYTPAGGHIRVELSETPASVELRVIDDGIGVPKADQHHLFNKFYRAGNARKARPDGTGLGLYMAKKVVVAQGGAVIFDSTEHKGSTFGFIFSKTKLAPSGKPNPVAVATTSVVR